MRKSYGRYELKYFIPMSRMHDILSHVRDHIQPDPHAEVIDNEPQYTIRSVYLDTQDLTLYYEKQDGLKDRKKFRVRSYSIPQQDTHVFMEIKYRYNTQVMKDRARFSLSHLQALLDGRVQLESFDVPLAIRKPAERFCYYKNEWGLQPVVTVIYNRKPYVGRLDANARLTIDTQLRVVDHQNENNLFAPVKEQPVPLPGAILELKFDRLMPEWMRSILYAFDVRQQSISKYAYCVDAALFDTFEPIPV